MAFSEAASAPRAASAASNSSRPDVRQHTFGTDVLRCPTCGGRRRIRALFATWAKAEARLAKLGVTLPSRLLPQATAPPQLPLRFV